MCLGLVKAIAKPSCSSSFDTTVGRAKNGINYHVVLLLVT